MSEQSVGETVYDLTESQKDLVRWIVGKVRAGHLGEEFHIAWTNRGPLWVAADSGQLGDAPEITKGRLDALEQNGLLRIDRHEQTRTTGSSRNPQLRTSETSRRCILTAKIFEAVDQDFAQPDSSFVRHLTPLADISNLDVEIRNRCLPILGAGAADPRLWDSAVRTAGVILEERLREVGGITDVNRVGRDLVNDVFGKNGSLAAKFQSSSEREGYRDLYAGIVGAFRNPSAHALLDPTPEDSGAYLVFLSLLLGKLETLR